MLFRMAPFWKMEDGQWRSGLIAIVLFLLFTASYDFVKEGRGSLSGLGDLLLAVSAIALAPLEAQPRVRPLIWSVLHSPRYIAGGCALVASVGLFVYRVTTGIKVIPW